MKSPAPEARERFCGESGAAVGSSAFCGEYGVRVV